MKAIMSDIANEAIDFLDKHYILSTREKLAILRQANIHLLKMQVAEAEAEANIEDHGDGFTSKPSPDLELRDVYYGNTIIRRNVRRHEIREAIRDFGDRMSRD
jgi:hypothetical protein